MTDDRIECFGIGDSRFNIVKQIRTAVFTCEQGADAAGEFDDCDETALFALLYHNGRSAATARLAETENGFKIGRIAVLENYRKKGLGAGIVAFLLNRAFELGAGRVLVDSQLHAVPFYEKMGFCVCGSEIIDRGLLHIPMQLTKADYFEKSH